MRRSLPILLIALACTAVPRAAAADITAFLGLTTTPENRAARGLAFGFGLLIIGFEFEYANTAEDELTALPSLRTGSANILVQTPIDIAGIALYATGGTGLYRERLLDHQETHLATNLGGGAKVRLLGPLRVRLDYRVFRLQGTPLYETYHRFYVGGNLAF